jgi:hypothetical protein
MIAAITHPTIRHSMWSAVAAALCVATIAGCSSAPQPKERMDYSASLNRYYQGRPMCLWPETVKFPMENAAPEQVHGLGLDALVGSGLLVRKHGNSFDLTPEGRSSFSPDVFNKGAGNFCYGRRKVVSVDAAEHNSRSSELVAYHYSVADPAAWAKEVEIQHAFPQIAPELAGVHKAQATLLDTTEGFEVAGTPTQLEPSEKKPATQFSSLTRTKVVLAATRKQGE